MIIFETIRWKNFLSTGDQWTEIDFRESSSTLIIGNNGAGKSTMLDALCFALFGKAFRKINKPQLVNSINEKDAKVEVTFSIGKEEYRVFRSIKPNAFELYKNNKLVDQDAATKDTQKYLEQSILKLNYKSFTQVVILGSSTFIPFMQLAASHRREVMEDLLDINVFSSMNNLLKDRIRSAQTQSRDCQHLLSLAEQRVNAQKKLLNSLTEINESRQEEKQNKVNLNNETIEKLKLKVKKLESSTKDYVDSSINLDDWHQQLSSAMKEKSHFTNNLKEISKNLKFFKENSQCPTCHQHIDERLSAAKTEMLISSGRELTQYIKHLDESTKEHVDVIKNQEGMDQMVRELRKETSETEREIVRIEFVNLEIQKEIVNLQQVTPNIDREKETMVSLQVDMSNTETDCSGVSKKLDEFQVVSSLLKDSGIKSQIIKKYVPVFNQLINKYLQSMDFFVNFTLDEEFNEVIKSRFRDEFSYASFSEGEKQKIDLALLFTWREVARMKNSVATNLLILDEVFDSSLDASGTGELLQILRSLGNDTNVFVISHKGEILVDKFLRTIKFEKINDFSKMSDDS